MHKTLRFLLEKFQKMSLASSQASTHVGKGHDTAPQTPVSSSWPLDPLIFSVNSHSV